MYLKKSKLALAVAAGLTFSTGAFATNGIIQAGNGMAAHGVGGAGVSNANEAMSGFDNPALISDTGDSLSIGFSMFSPLRSWDVPAAGVEFKSDANMFAIPQIAFTSKLNEQMSWGIMVNAMGGMNTSYRAGMIDFLANGDPQGVDLSGLIIAPTMSFAPSKGMSFGASLIVGYETLRLTNAFGLGDEWNNGTVGSYATNEGSTMAYGVKLGADFKLGNAASVGVVLQPKLAAGELDFFKGLLGGFGFTGDAGLALPNIAGIGGKFKAGKDFDIVADVMYYQWSSVDVFEFFGWEDQTVLKLGVEYRPTSKLALRAGFNYGESPIQGDVLAPAGLPAVMANYLFPAISETHVTVGLGYQMDKNMAVNAYYLHAPETTIDDTFGTGLALTMSQNAFGLGINYRTK